MRNHLSRGPQSIFWFGGASLSSKMPGACSSGQVWKLELLKSSEMCLFLSILRKFCQILMLVQLIGYMKEDIQWTSHGTLIQGKVLRFNISEKLWMFPLHQNLEYFQLGRKIVVLNVFFDLLNNFIFLSQTLFEEKYLSSLRKLTRTLSKFLYAVKLCWSKHWLCQ